MKNFDFCEDMSKSKNANRLSLIIYLELNVFFMCFWVELCKTLEKDWLEIKISTRMKKFQFWVKNAVFINNKNDSFLNSDFWFTWLSDHSQQDVF